MIAFHKLLITTAIAFCVLFAMWGFHEYQVTHTTWAIASAIAFAVFALGLGFYLANLRKFLGS